MPFEMKIESELSFVRVAETNNKWIFAAGHGTVMVISFRTDKSGQTVQTQIKVFTVFYSIGIFWTKYPKVWAFCLNYRLITTKLSSVPKFRNFTVLCVKPVCFACKQVKD